MEFKYLDAHCHVQFDAFDPDREALIETMREQNVGGIVVGCDFDSSEKAVAAATAHEHLFASVGLHPNHETDEWFDAARYEKLAAHPKVVAIGECGLDYFRPVAVNDEVKEKQKALLLDHVALAAKLDKPLIIHSRPSKGTTDAYQDLIALLKDAKKVHPNLSGDIHFFVGGVDEMRELTALGFTVSFTAVVTFAHDYDAVIQAAPLDIILSETDAPYVAPASRRGKRNDPLAVVDVVSAIARIRGEDVEVVRKTLVANTQRVFKIV